MKPQIAWPNFQSDVSIQYVWPQVWTKVYLRTHKYAMYTSAPKPYPRDGSTTERRHDKSLHHRQTLLSHLEPPPLSGKHNKLNHSNMYTRMMYMSTTISGYIVARVINTRSPYDTNVRTSTAQCYNQSVSGGFVCPKTRKAITHAYAIIHAHMW